MSDEEHPDLLTPDAGLVRRAQSIYGDYTASRVGIVADRPGNPLAAEVRRFGSAVACRAPVFGEHLFNRAFGFTDEYLDEALEVISWYEEAGVAGAFEIAPGLPNDELLALLHAHGLRHTGFHAMFAGRVGEAPDPPEGVDVLRLEDTGHIEAFSDAYHRGWNFDVRVPVEPWLHAPGWSLYLGLCDGSPAGAGVLYLSGGAPTSPTRPSTRATGGGACTARCWNGALPRRGPPERRSCSPARPSSRRAIATCCATVCRWRSRRPSGH